MQRLKLSSQPCECIPKRCNLRVSFSRCPQIVFEDTSAQFVGSSIFKDLPRLDFPQLLPEMFRPPRDMRYAVQQCTLFWFLKGLENPFSNMDPWNIS